ncbi:ACP S-malonyltransferase [Streptomyces paludis]|uniref:[acyl-carrier-protein] S-malonyltransferase n=1 Tax=Streptomyces paludis TaxID=2282738 RepID=A0A345HY48_9ACTN|nr:acyltransferase domain-containing protein [Streptomyces paludis]AXG81622.1 acyltransferase domain-containing protein [Streptomyces paludis]
MSRDPGRVSKVPSAWRRLARTLAALPGSPPYVRAAGAGDASAARRTPPGPPAGRTALLSEHALDLGVALFPGQGAYRPGALAAFWERGSPAVRDTFATVDAVARERLGREVSPTLFRPSPPSPAALLDRAPDLHQLAVLAVSVATYRLLAERGARPAVHLGHSLGEIAALTCAGAYGLADATALLCERISVVRAHASGAGTMLALRCGRVRAERLVELIGHPSLVVAVDNAAEQTVLSGPPEAIGTAGAIARQLGITATPLRFPHPFHNPLLAGARRELASRIGVFSTRPVNVPVYSAILGRFYRDGDDLAGLLALHLVAPVEYRTSVAALYAAGARTFVEVGAGRVLTGLAAEAHPGVYTAAPLAGRDEEAGLTRAAAALSAPDTGRLPGAEGAGQPVLAVVERNAAA